MKVFSEKSEAESVSIVFHQTCVKFLEQSDRNKTTTEYSRCTSWGQSSTTNGRVEGRCTEHLLSNIAASTGIGGASFQISVCEPSEKLSDSTVWKWPTENAHSSLRTNPSY